MNNNNKIIIVNSVRRVQFGPHQNDTSVPKTSENHRSSLDQAIQNPSKSTVKAPPTMAPQKFGHNSGLVSKALPRVPNILQMWYSAVFGSPSRTAK